MSPSSGPGESRGLALYSFILAFLCAPPPPPPVFTPDPPSSGLCCWEKPQQPAWGVSQLPEASGLPGEPEIGLSEREGEGGSYNRERSLPRACMLPLGLLPAGRGGMGSGQPLWHHPRGCYLLTGRVLGCGSGEGGGESARSEGDCLGQKTRGVCDKTEGHRIWGGALSEKLISRVPLTPPTGADIRRRKRKGRLVGLGAGRGGAGPASLLSWAGMGWAPGSRGGVRRSVPGVISSPDLTAISGFLRLTVGLPLSPEH